MALKTEQLAAVINSVTEQTLGRGDLAITDSKSVVALGEKIFSSSDITSNFMNTLVMRIGRTIMSYRMYSSIMRPMVFDTIRWGALVQKFKVQMPKAMEDKAYDLVDGESIDQWIIMKPKADQKFFIKRTPYSFGITIQKWQLQRAFLGMDELNAFVSAIFGEVRNALEVGFENLAYLTLDNFMVNLPAGRQVRHLVTEYNAVSGKNLTSDNAEYDSGYLRFAITQMNLAASRLRTMSTLYNAGDAERHTPYEYQRFVVIDEFEEALKTVVQWEAFHEQYVQKAASITVPYFQSAQQPREVSLNATLDADGESGDGKTLSNIIGCIHDRDALGVYLKEEEVLTTPVNARGRYTNTFWHNEQMWINDYSENGIVFCND